jgi:multidrug resistance efflux pump
MDDISIRADRRTDAPHDADDLLWRQFDEATGPEAFARMWLTLQCRMIAGVASGVLVLKTADAGRFAPAALWPDGRRARPHLGQVAERALQERRAVIVPVPQPQSETEPAGAPRVRYDVALPLEAEGELEGVVALDVPARTDREAEAVIRQLRWGVAWLEISRMRRDSARAAVVRDRLQTVLDLVAAGFGHKRFTAAATAFVTAVATRLGAERVTLGFGRGGHAKVVAVSHSAKFSGNSNLVRAVEQAMDEAMDQRAVVVWPQPVDWPPQVARNHAELSRQHGAGGVVCTAPLVEGAGVLGALTIERAADLPFDKVTLELIEVLAALAGPILERGRRDDQWLGAKMLDAGRDFAERIFGPGHLKLKISLGLAAVALLLLVTVPGDFRVASNASLEPVIRQAMTAPFSGYIAQAPARAGDIVTQGTVMAALDDRDLRLSKLKWRSQQEQLTRQYHQAMANRNAAAVVILTAQIDQAKAEVALIEYQLAHTRVTAPFRGIIVSGDLSQSLAAPIERGQVMFELAPLDAYRVVLQVDERDVSYLKVGQRGTLLLTGTPSEPMGFAVEKITPVSTAKEGHNYFRVEGKLDQQLDRLRPGMEGVGKVEIDRRLYAWIWTRQVIDWIRLTLWKWLP